MDKNQVLTLDPDADYFELNGRVYKTGADWIEDEKLTKGEKAGEIQQGMANQLPVGAEIFAPKGRTDILIVEYEGREKRYLLQAGE
ncbi:hypothetical protein [Lentibacillus sediminis]|uniref:hypothetical protein n=1 Tax=Lentibacillus sediminis TaxID=1940529 RepID=UPI001EFEE46F|nr:hypothetical protein [Lentibacillus sediminis]